MGINKPSYKLGFTLIELSIVLVIIGLLVGGVLVGRDLIHAAAIRSQISQIEKFKTATNTFRVKYNYLTGDMPPSQAAQLGFFTFESIGGGSQKVSGMGISGMCAYGDNNGTIEDPERYVFWQHLSEAKLIEGQYGGTATSYHIGTAASGFLFCNTGNIVDSSNSPQMSLLTSQRDNFMPTAKLGGNVVIAPALYEILAGTPFYSIEKASENNYFMIITTANDNYTIDSKIDDAIPLTGKVRETTSSSWGHGSATNCTTGTYPNFTYDLTTAPDKPNTCLPAFLF